MTRVKFSVEPGEVLVNRGLQNRVPVSQTVTVERVTPTGRFTVVEYPHHTYEGVQGGDYALLRGQASNSRVPFAVRRPTPDQDLDVIRAEFTAWDAQEATKLERHQRMLSVRIKAERLLEDSKTPWGDRSMRNYPYTDNQIDLLDQLLTEMNATAKEGPK